MVSIIIPTFKERENIEEIIKGVFAVLDANGLEGEVIIADDGSTDGSAELAEKLLKRYRGKVIKRQGPKGLALAVVDGFKVAEGDIIGVMDSDLSHPPSFIPDLIAYLKNDKVDLVIGSRYIEGGQIKQWPFWRRVVSLVASFLARLVTSVKDATSGFFFFKRQIIAGVKLDPKGFKICLELIVKARYAGLKEVPYTFVNRKAGASKLNLNAIGAYLIQLVKLIFFRLRHKLSLQE